MFILTLIKLIFLFYLDMGCAFLYTINFTLRKKEVLNKSINARQCVGES